MTEKSASDDWRTRGKSVRQLIKELQSFEDDTLEVKISIDYGETFRPISLVTKSAAGTNSEHAGLLYCGD